MAVSKSNCQPVCGADDAAAWDVAKYTKTCAYICAAQMPMIIALAGKNNLIARK